MCFSAGMLMSMKRKFNFVNITGNVFDTTANALVDWKYDTNVSSATAA